MIKKYSDEKRKEVIDARKAGATIAQIAAQTGVGRTTVKAWLKAAGLTARRKWKVDEIQAILKEYEECRSPKNRTKRKSELCLDEIKIKNSAINEWIAGHNIVRISFFCKSFFSSSFGVVSFFVRNLNFRLRYTTP